MTHPLEQALREVAATLRQRGYPEHEVEAAVLSVVDDVAAGRAPLLDGYLHVGAVEERYPELPAYRKRLPAWVYAVVVLGLVGAVWWGGYLRFGANVTAPVWVKWLTHLLVAAWPTVVVWAYCRRDYSVPTSAQQALERVREYPVRPA